MILWFILMHLEWTWGVFLCKIGKWAAYGFRQLKVHYPTHDLEIAVMVFDFKICRHYLYGVHLDRHTDHKCLQ